MIFRVLGSGSCEIRRDRSSPAYLLEAGSTSLLLDLGQGALRRLVEAGRDPANLTGVLLSHHHLDHMADLPPLVFALNYDPHMNHNAALTLAAHEGFQPVWERLQNIFGSWLKPDPRNLGHLWLQPGRTFRLGEVEISAAPARHMETSLAYRLKAEGADLVYLGDSEAAPELAEFAAGTSLLVVHTAVPEASPRPGHAHPSAAGDLALEAGAKALLLSHFYRDVDPGEAVAQAAAIFPGPVWAARDHLEFLVTGQGAMPRPD